MSVHWPIIRQLPSSPRREVIVDDRRPYRAIEILVGALHIAEAVSRRSNSRTLGVLLPTSGVFPMALLAGWMLGRTVVPLNYRPMNWPVIDDCETDWSHRRSHADFLRSSHKEEPRRRRPPWRKSQNLVRLDG